MEHFSRLGHPVPERWTPSDHFIELLTQKEEMEKLVAAWADTEPAAATPRPVPDSVERRGDSPPFFYQTRILLPRSAKRITRSYLTKTATAMHLSLAVVWGFIYWHVGSDMPRRLTDFVGAIFFIVAHWSWTPLFQGLNNFPKEKEMLTKEKASRTYDIGAYFWAQTIAEAPILLVYPFMFFLLAAGVGYAKYHPSL